MTVYKKKRHYLL